MEGQTSKQLSWHPSDAALVSHLDGQSGWVESLRVRFHLRRCKECAGRWASIEKEVNTLSPSANEQELGHIRRNLMQAIRAYEQVEPKYAFHPAPELRKTLEAYVGSKMAAQLAERACNTSDSRAAYQHLDRTLRLLLGGKAAAGLRAKLLQERPQ